AYARIHGLPRIWIKALKIKPGYVIEVISENYDKLSIEEKIMILIHELLHIPRTFSGGLRPHGKYVNRRIVRKLFSKFMERCGIEFLLSDLKCNQW
ncbi:MAG: metallopeptidase, partial [Staphylothermus sp.]|nr:metallopeptidase [Staphylothermus sp.]